MAHRTRAISTGSPAASASRARGVLIGGTIGVIATLLLAEFVARLDGTPSGWGLAIGVAALAAVPMTAVGVILGISIEERRASALATPERAPAHPLGGMAGFLMGLWAVVAFGPFNAQVREMLGERGDVSPALVATTNLLLRVVTLVGIWLVGRGTARAISEALDTRGGRRSLPDVALVALVFWFGAFNLAIVGIGDLFSDSPRVLFHPAIDLGLALLFAAIARALVRRSRYAFHLALAFAAAVIVVMVAMWVLSPADADFLQGFRDTLIASTVMVAFVWYVRRRLSPAPIPRGSVGR